MGQSQSDSLAAFAAERLARLEKEGLRRELHATSRHGAAAVKRGGRRLISFCDNDYLGLASDPRVARAAADAALAHGAGAGAARLVTGDCPLNAEVETKLAAMKQMPAARVFGSGYLANIGTIPAVVGPGDLIVIDHLAHSCLHTGARLSGAEVRVLPHNYAEQAHKLLEGDFPRKLLVTETVFSMDGDIAPLAALSAACDEHGAWLMTDDAHGFGVVKLDNPAPIQSGTLSKAAGGYGGYVAGSRELIDLLTSRARSFVYATGLPPAVLGAASVALDIMQAEPERGARAMAHARLFSELVGLHAAKSAIVPVLLGDAHRAMRASAALEAKGFLVTAIRPPTVPDGMARLRVTFSAAHEEADVRRLAEAVSEIRK